MSERETDVAKTGSPKHWEERHGREMEGERGVDLEERIDEREITEEGIKNVEDLYSNANLDQLTHSLTHGG